jgi:DNA polymerase III delta subunit
VSSFLLGRDLEQKDIVPCFFFHGEESFLAEEFIFDLKEHLISPEVQDYNIERFNLDDNSWMEIIDLARTIPFFLSAWRIIVVELVKGQGESLSNTEKSILSDYFDSPSDQTVLVLVFSGKLRKNSALYKFFSSLKKSVVSVKELKPLRQQALLDWIDRRVLAMGKTATLEAKKRIEELVGRDLRTMNNELEKLITFVGENNVIELDDVNQVSGRAKTFFEWEMQESLDKADFEKSLLVLNNLFKEGIRTEFIVGIIVRFYREILLAKLWLREQEKDRKAIFKQLKPHIHEGYGAFYRSKFQEFFGLVEKLSVKDLNYFLDELGKIDLRIKTSDASAQTLLESFLFDYCRFRKKGGIR